jgi:hypothetical protein
MKKILSVLFLLWFLFVSFSVASNQRKYASTRMVGCEENDIIMRTRVWASCNSNYDLTVSKYYTWKNSQSTDMNWWNYGRLYYEEYVTCPDWYIVPKYNDFLSEFDDIEDIRTLKLPAWWYIDDWDHSFVKIDLVWAYIVSDNGGISKLQAFSFNSNHYSKSSLPYSIHDYWSLRCMRVAPATKEEKIWNRSIVNQSNTWNFGISTNLDFGISANLDFAVASGSKDEYVNAKLNEINDCFLNIYSWHLNTIISAWQKLLQQKNTAKSPLEIKKYEKALSKINEIKVLFEKRYKFLFTYTSKKTSPTTGTNYLPSNKLSQ